MKLMPKLVHSSQLTVDRRFKKTVNCKPITVNCKSKGFTLIELLVAIIIISTLVSIGTFAFNNALDKGRDARRKEDLKAIKTALVAYYQDHETYPDNPLDSNQIEFISDGSNNWIPNLVASYINQLPNDPGQTVQAGGTVPQSKTITANFDEFARTSGICNRPAVNSISSVIIGNLSPPSNPNNNKFRTYFRFDLSDLPDNPTITKAELISVNVTRFVGGGADINIQAYNGNGQTDPANPSYTCLQRYDFAANDATPYVTDTNIFSQNGVKNILLSGANQDVQNAKAAVNRFSIAINEDGSSPGSYNYLESIENTANNEPKLIISYTQGPPDNCSSSDRNYCYIVTGTSGNRPTFTLWAQLDNTKDPEIYDKPGAICTGSPPAGFNYCLKSE